MQRDPSLIQFNDLSTLSQKKFERARSKYLLDKLTGKLNNADYFLQLTRSMAELNGTDSEEFLADLYAKAKLQKEADQPEAAVRINLNVNDETKPSDEPSEVLPLQ
jgi:dynein heavy chain